MPNKPSKSLGQPKLRLAGRDPKELPRYIDGEYLIIAACLTDRSKALDVLQNIPAAAFTENICRLAAKALLEMRASSDSQLHDNIKQLTGDPEAIVRLTSVLDDIDGKVVIKDEVARVVDKYVRREAILHHNSQIDALLVGEESAVDNVGKSINKLVNIATLSQDDPLIGVDKIVKAREEGLRERKRTGRILTGFTNIDKYLGEGFIPGDVSVIAARPNVGKSAFKQNVIVNLCEQGVGVLNCVPEVGFMKEQDRINAIRTGTVLSEYYHSDNWSDDFVKRDVESTKYIQDNWKYWCQPYPMLSFSRTRYDIERLVLSGLQVVFVDLFDRYEEISNSDRQASIIKSLLREQAALAKKHNIHICNLVQIRRQSQDPLAKARKFKPTIEDLKDSGGYEEVADTIFLLYRPAKHFPDIMDNHLIVIIAKQRGGSADEEATLSVDWETTTMEDAHEDQFSDTGDVAPPYDSSATADTDTRAVSYRVKEADFETKSGGESPEDW